MVNTSFSNETSESLAEKLGSTTPSWRRGKRRGTVVGRCSGAEMLSTTLPRRCRCVCPSCLGGASVCQPSWTPSWKRRGWQPSPRRHPRHFHDTSSSAFSMEMHHHWRSLQVSVHPSISRYSLDVFPRSGDSAGWLLMLKWNELLIPQGQQFHKLPLVPPSWREKH